jgi:hypothetical protein
MSPDEMFIYHEVGSQIRRIDAISGEAEFLGQLPFDQYHYTGTGMAVYVPEPGTLVLLLALVGAALGGKARCRR